MNIPRVIKNADCSGELPRLPIHPAQVRSAAPDAEHASMTTVECIKEGDTVRYIDVRCRCGHVTRLICDYGSVRPAPNATPVTPAPR